MYRALRRYARRESDLPVAVGRRERAAVRLHYRARHRESHAGAGAGARLVSALESLEHARERLTGHARAGVAHLQPGV